MKYKDARTYIEECKNEDGSLNEDELINLVLWAYDQGFGEGIEDYIEENNLKKKIINNNNILMKIDNK